MTKAPFVVGYLKNLMQRLLAKEVSTRCDSGTWGSRVDSGTWGHRRDSGSWGSKLVPVLVLLLAIPALAHERHAKLSPELAAADSGKADVIVQFKSAPSDEDLAAFTKFGGHHKAHLRVIHGAAFSNVPVAALKQLADNSKVAYISPDRPLHASSVDYTAQTVNANAAWSSGLDGSGIGIAIIDSGVNLVNDLKTGSGPGATSRIVYNQNFASDAGTNDLYGHGTHVAGIVAGAGQSSSGPGYTYTVKGIAPGANIINLRVLNANGAGTDSAVISAIQTAINLKSTYNIRVINLSLGRQVFESYALDPLCQAVEQAWKAGIVVVVAAGNQGRNNSAGNNGYGTIAAPGNDPYAITVGAMRTMGTSSRADDLIATYSSKGPTAYDYVVKPDIVAPGNNAISLLAKNSTLWNTLSATNAVINGELGVSGPASTGDSNAYFRLSGTSMATPVVSGAAALMLQADSTLTPDTVKARLMKSASKTFPLYSSWTDPLSGTTYTEQYDIFTVGAGYLDIAAALASTDVVPANLNANSPTASYDSTTGNVYLVGGDSILWGSSILWGASTVWGNTVLWGNSMNWGSTILWGSSICWGANTQQGFTILWGSSIMWGASTDGATGLSVQQGEN